MSDVIEEMYAFVSRKETNKLSPDAEIYEFPEEERHYHDE